MDEKHLFKPQIMSTIIEMLPHTQTKDLESHMLNELRNMYMNLYDSKYVIIRKIRNIIKYTEGEIINDNYGTTQYHVMCNIEACKPIEGDEFIGTVSYKTKTFIKIVVGRYIEIIIMIGDNNYGYVLEDKDDILIMKYRGEEHIIQKGTKLKMRALKVNNVIPHTETTISIYGHILNVIKD